MEYSEEGGWFFASDGKLQNVVLDDFQLASHKEIQHSKKSIDKKLLKLISKHEANISY